MEEYVLSNKNYIDKEPGKIVLIGDFSESNKRYIKEIIEKYKDNNSYIGIYLIIIKYTSLKNTIPEIEKLNKELHDYIIYNKGENKLLLSHFILDTTRKKDYFDFEYIDDLGLRNDFSLGTNYQVIRSLKMVDNFIKSFIHFNNRKSKKYDLISGDINNIRDRYDKISFSEINGISEYLNHINIYTNCNKNIIIKDLEEFYPIMFDEFYDIFEELDDVYVLQLTKHNISDIIKSILTIQKYYSDINSDIDNEKEIDFSIVIITNLNKNDFKDNDLYSYLIDNSYKSFKEYLLSL